MLTVGKDEKRRYRKDIKDMVALLSMSGHDTPTEEDYAEFQRMREEAGDTAGVLKGRLRHIRNYFAYTPSGETPPAVEAVAEKKEENEAPKRTEKVSLYLTPEVYSAGQDLARMSRKSFAEYIALLLQRDIEAKSEGLKEFRELLRRLGNG